MNHYTLVVDEIQCLMLNSQWLMVNLILLTVTPLISYRRIVYIYIYVYNIIGTKYIVQIYPHDSLVYLVSCPRMVYLHIGRQTKLRGRWRNRRTGQGQKEEKGVLGQSEKWYMKAIPYLNGMNRHVNVFF